MNIGRLLHNAVERFDSRVLAVIEEYGQAGLRASHISLTRNLDITGTRAVELARRAGMTKQAMGEIIAECESLGFVERQTDVEDRRAKIVRFTDRGLQWLEAFRVAVAEAERELTNELGSEAAAVFKSSLRRYAIPTDR